MPYEQALLNYGASIKRAYLHKALNRRLQGSAADIMKVAMLTCWENGIFNETGVPHVTVHDELGFSCSDDPRQLAAFDAMAHCMETALPMHVPIKVECETGADWGNVE